VELGATTPGAKGKIGTNQASMKAFTGEDVKQCRSPPFPLAPL